MIIPDINILIHAYDTGFLHHEVAKRWWEDTARTAKPVGLPWWTILGFIRIITNRSILENPRTVDSALSIARLWLRQPGVRIVTPGQRHAEILFELLGALGIAGDLTPDAHLAALAIEYQAEIASTDNDFGRFPGVRWFNPLKGTASGSRRR
jgi:toxin-antitoxin system PIN domain toxin